ncbi:MAG: hypothetical protein AB8G99_13465 [Planctomycetaceae bacterium]
MTNPKHRSGRSRVAIIGIGVLLLLGGIFIFSVLSRTSEVTTKLIELKQAGLPTSGAELNDFYIVPSDAEDTTKVWISACDRIKTQDFNSKVMELPILGRGGEVPPFDEEWTQLPEAKEAVEITLKTELEAVRQATKAGGRVRFPVDFKQGINTLLTNTQEMRTLARLLCLDAHVAARENDTERVLNDIRGVFAVSNALAEEPTLISQLVRIAVNNVAINLTLELVPYCELNDQQLADLQRTISQADLKRSLFRAYVGERAIGLEAIENFSPAPFRADNKLLALNLYEGAIRNHNAAWSDIQEYQTASDSQLRGLNSNVFSKMRYSAAALLLPSLSNTMTAFVRAEATKRTAILALAAMRQKLNGGEYPESGSLPDSKFFEHADDATIDPFSDEPMLAAQDETSLRYYSVGEDGIDNGGEIGETTSRARDTGFRLPLRN